MRELKFKAFHKPSKIMYWFDLMWGNNGQGNGWIGMVPFGELMTKNNHRDNVINIDPSDCDIMQFTGLKDINGTDIYEGDVMNGIQREQCDKEGENAYKVTERVVFNRGSFKVFGKHISDGYTRDNNCLYQFMWVETWGNIISSEKYFQIDEIEVIGNIHQNPELL